METFRRSTCTFCLAILLTRITFFSGNYTPTVGARKVAAPGAGLAPIKGMAYQPVPSDYSPCAPPCPYYDTDFYNADFPLLWGTDPGGRGDLMVMSQQLGINFLHLYDWNPARNHLPFLNEALKYGIRIAVPISNYFVIPGQDPNQVTDIQNIVKQVYVDTNGNPSKTPHPAVVMWTIANEYELSGIPPSAVAQAAVIIVQTETNIIQATTILPISVPVSYGIFNDPQLRPAIVPITNVINAFQANSNLPSDFVATRFIAATNPQNPGSFIKSWLPQYAAAFPQLSAPPPLWFSELGAGVLLSCTGTPSPPCIPSENQQALFNADAFANSPPGASGVLLGSAQFEFLNEYWKGDPNIANDSTFGVYKYTTPLNYQTYPTPGGTYRVDQLEQKPSWAALKNAFAGTIYVSSSTNGNVPSAARSVGGVAFTDLDILALDRRTDTWSIYFDASDVDLHDNDLDAFTLMDDDSILMSFNKPLHIPGLGSVDDSDVVRFVPTLIGERTAGHFEWYFDGSDTDLKSKGEDIDSLALAPDGRLIVGARGAFGVKGVSGRNEDLVAFKPKRLGAKTECTWELYLDGSDVDLADSVEDVRGTWIDPQTDWIYLSTKGPRAGHGTIKLGVNIKNDSHWVWVRANHFHRITGSAVIVSSGIYHEPHENGGHPTDFREFEGKTCSNIHIDDNDFDALGGFEFGAVPAAPMIA